MKGRTTVSKDPPECQKEVGGGSIYPVEVLTQSQQQLGSRLRPATLSHVKAHSSHTLEVDLKMNYLLFTWGAGGGRLSLRDHFEQNGKSFLV